MNCSKLRLNSRKRFIATTFFCGGVTSCLQRGKKLRLFSNQEVGEGVTSKQLFSVSSIASFFVCFVVFFALNWSVILFPLSSLKCSFFALEKTEYVLV